VHPSAELNFVQSTGLSQAFQDFLHVMDFIGNQTVQGPNESFSASSKGFK